MKGIFKWYNDARGIGFIQGEDGNDYFAHYSNFKAFGDGTRIHAYKGQKCEFDPAESEKGLKAMNIDNAAVYQGEEPKTKVTDAQTDKMEVQWA